MQSLHLVWLDVKKAEEPYDWTKHRTKNPAWSAFDAWLEAKLADPIKWRREFDEAKKAALLGR